MSNRFINEKGIDYIIEHKIQAKVICIKHAFLFKNVEHKYVLYIQPFFNEQRRPSFRFKFVAEGRVPAADNDPSYTVPFSHDVFGTTFCFVAKFVPGGGQYNITVSLLRTQCSPDRALIALKHAKSC